ncbi:unnamed protein product [Candida parapsilosis]
MPSGESSLKCVSAALRQSILLRSPQIKSKLSQCQRNENCELRLNPERHQRGVTIKEDVFILQTSWRKNAQIFSPDRSITTYMLSHMDVDQGFAEFQNTNSIRGESYSCYIFIGENLSIEEPSYCLRSVNKYHSQR